MEQSKCRKSDGTVATSTRLVRGSMDTSHGGMKHSRWSHIFSLPGETPCVGFYAASSMPWELKTGHSTIDVFAIGKFADPGELEEYLLGMHPICDF